MLQLGDDEFVSKGKYLFELKIDLENLYNELGMITLSYYVCIILSLMLLI